MEESKRQKQVAALLNEEINSIFQKLGLNMLDGGMVSVSGVKVTPDLLEARFYLSFFQVKDAAAALKRIEDRHHEIKKSWRHPYDISYATFRCLNFIAMTHWIMSLKWKP